MSVDIWFESPTLTSPATSTALTFSVQIGWSLDKIDRSKGAPKIQLTASPTPSSISGGGIYTVVGTETWTRFTVIYSPSAAAFAATLTAKLFVNGDTTGAADDSADVPIRVTGRASGGPTPANPPPDDTTLFAKEGLTAALAETDEGDAPDSEFPFFIGGLSTPADHYQPAAAVICVVARFIPGIFTPRFVGSAMLLPKDTFVVTLDPGVRGQGLSYQLFLVDELGEILEIRSQPIP